MNTDFSEKLNDLARWCNAAYRQHNDSHYSEALMNMRKGAEAFCKLVLYYKHPRQYADLAVSGKSLKELIAILRNENIVPVQIIHSLETLQIHGNMAAHDNTVNSEQSVVALSSLKLMIRWLFDALLKTPVQPGFKEMLGMKAGGEKKNVHDKSKEEDLKKLRSEKESLEKQIEELRQNRHHETERIEQLSEQLKRSGNQIEKITQSFEERKEQEIKKAEDEKEKVTLNIEPVIPTHRNAGRKKIISAAIVLLFIAGAAITWKQFYHLKNTKEDHVETKISDDSLDAVILPFSVLQDNPNLNIKIEDNLLSNLREGIRYYNLPFRISLDTGFHTEAITLNQMSDYSEKHKKRLIISGELYEQTLGDSNQANLMITMNKGRQMITPWRVDKLKFNNLNDSAGKKILDHCYFYMNVTIADYYMNTNRFARAVALLYQSKALNQSEAGLASKLISQCQISLGNFKAAELDAKKFISAYPDQAMGYMMLGIINSSLKNFTEAEKNYKKALTIKPDDIEALLYLSQLYTQPEMTDYDKAGEYAMLAIKYDTNSVASWAALAQTEQLKRNRDLAISHYKKCLQLNPAFLYARQGLTKIYWEQKQDYDSAIVQMELMLKQDSSNMFALKGLAETYTAMVRSDPAKAGYYLKKAEAAGGDTALAYKYSKAIQAYTMHDVKKAEPLLLDYYNLDSNNMGINTAIYNTYFNMKKFDRALYYLNHALSLDSFNYVVCYNAGFFYLNAPPPYKDESRAAYYFERTRMINPYDSLSLQYLASIYTRNGKLNEAKQVCRQLEYFKPDDMIANEALSEIYERLGNIDSALYYYKRSYKLFPDDAYQCGMYSKFLMDNNLAKEEDIMALAKHAVKLDPDNADNHFALARVYYYFKLFDLCRDEYYKATGLNPALKNDSLENFLIRRTP